MEKGIDVEFLDLSQLTTLDSFVLIHVNIGNMPPSRMYKHITNVRENLPLCVMLDSKRIKYAVVACTPDGIKAMHVAFEHNDSTDTIEETVTNFDDALKAIE